MILHAIQTFEGTPEEIFPFFADARNLERITPGSLKFRILTENPIEMSEGATIDYALRINGIPVRWRSEILDWHPGLKFVDRQLRGPYRKWVHEHRFIDLGSRTEMHDIVEYEAPGPAFVERKFVRPQLRQIFEYRQQVLAWSFRQVGQPSLVIAHAGESPQLGSATDARIVAG
jgi:ligand-binding SRPBCC domain-containing protein